MPGRLYILTDGSLQPFELATRKFQFPTYPLNYWTLGITWINVKEAKLNKTRLTANPGIYNRECEHIGFIDAFLILLEREDATSFLISRVRENEYVILGPNEITSSWDHLYWQLTSKNYESNSFFSKTKFFYGKVSRNKIKAVGKTLKNKLTVSLIDLIIDYM